MKMPYVLKLSISKSNSKNTIYVLMLIVHKVISYLSITFFASVMSQGGLTPLHMAAANRSPEVCKLLIKEGKADVDRQNNVRFLTFYSQTVLFQKLLPFSPNRSLLIICVCKYYHFQ